MQGRFGNYPEWIESRWEIAVEIVCGGGGQGVSMSFL